MRDPYTVLGVSKSADEAEIKSAFRKLAKRYHPDRNKDDPKAKDQFAEVNNAYEIIGDKDKKAKFDRGEIDAEGKPRGFEGFGGGGGGGGGPFGRGGNPFGGGGAEGFSFDFGRGGRGGGGSQGMSEEDLAELLRGFGMGGGAGGAGMGSGGRQQRSRQAAPAGRDIAGEVSLPLEEVASGTTRRVGLPGGRTVEVKIPAWIGDGKVMRLAGQGEESPMGGKNGDVLLTIRHAPHGRFTVEGGNLRVRVPLPLVDAVLGGPIRVPTLTGEVEMNVPANTSGGRTFRLRGQGLQVDGTRGDILATVDIQVPNDPELTELMRKRRG